MTKKRIIIIVCIAVVIIGGAIFLLTRKAGTQYTTATAQKEKIVESITATGTVKPAQDLNLNFQIQGRVARVNVKVGDAVSTGKELARLDISESSIQLAESLANLDVAKARLAQVQAGSSAQEIAIAQTTLDNAKNNSAKEIASAEQNLIDVKQKATEDLSSSYNDALNYLSSSLNTAQNSLNTAKTILDDVNVNSYIDTQKLYTARDKKSTADYSYNTTKSYVDTAKSTNNQSDIDTALTKLSSTLDTISDTLSSVNDVLYSSTVTQQLTQTTLDTYKTNISTARSNTNTAKTNITSSVQDIASQKLTNTKNINTAQSSLDTTKASWSAQIDSAQKQLDLKTAPIRQTDIALYTAQVKQSEASVSQARNQINKGILRSPINGKVSQVNIKLGELSSLTGTAISIINTQSFDIEADIPESDIGRINLMDPVKITYDAFPNNAIINGKIAQIDPAEKIVEGVIYYKVTVTLDVTDNQLRSGLTANLEIITAEKDNVITVPQRAVIENQDKKIKILENNQVREVVVTTGIRGNQGEIEILTGVKEGDKVITSSTAQ